jgi:hypothetical protein
MKKISLLTILLVSLSINAQTERIDLKGEKEYKPTLFWVYK